MWTLSSHFHHLASPCRTIGTILRCAQAMAAVEDEPGRSYHFLPIQLYGRCAQWFSFIGNRLWNNARIVETVLRQFLHPEEGLVTIRVQNDIHCRVESEQVILARSKYANQITFDYNQSVSQRPARRLQQPVPIVPEKNINTDVLFLPVQNYGEYVGYLSVIFQV
jgi:hypothetical protein